MKVGREHGCNCRGVSVCSAAQSRNDDRNPCGTTSMPRSTSSRPNVALDRVLPRLGEGNTRSPLRIAAASLEDRLGKDAHESEGRRLRFPRRCSYTGDLRAPPCGFSPRTDFQPFVNSQRKMDPKVRLQRRQDGTAPRCPSRGVATPDNRQASAAIVALAMGRRDRSSSDRWDVPAPQTASRS